MPKINVLDNIPVKLIRDMQHAIGWGKNKVTGTKHRVMHAYRNRYVTCINDPWESLVFFGLAERAEPTKNGFVQYSLTPIGLDFLGNLCGLKIVEVD